MAIIIQCSKRGCNETVLPCRKHSRSPTRSGYNSTRWRKERLIYLRQNPICAGKWSLCEKAGIVKASTDKDHDKRVTGPDDPTFYTGPFNALCHECHLVKTVAEQGGYS